jgi:hypothetical protein
MKLLLPTSKHKKFDAYTFIELDTLKGYYHYFCMNKAIEMGLNTDGILLMSDDVLLKYWDLSRLDPDKMWYPYRFEQICNTELKVGNPALKKWWWRAHMGAQALFNVWDFFNKTKTGLIRLEEESLEIVASFLANLDKVNPHLSKYPRVCGLGSDAFYLPRSKLKRFRLIGDVFRSFGVFLEIAVPTILAGLNGADEPYELFNGTYAWHSRANLELYEKFGYFAHPVKLSLQFGPPHGLVFCQKFVQDKFRYF